MSNLNPKIINQLSNTFMVLGICLSGYGLYKVYTIRASLPAGVCPIDNNRPILFFAIGALLISLVLSYLADWMVKQVQNQDDEIK